MKGAPWQPSDAQCYGEGGGSRHCPRATTMAASDLAPSAKAATHLFRGKTILAPMVRCGTLPLRLLALDYGADTVFTEELVDHKVKKLVRRENPRLGCVDFWLPGSKEDALVFRTLPRAERNRLVLQLGSASPETAVAAALVVENDVAGTARQDAP